MLWALTLNPPEKHNTASRAMLLKGQIALCDNFNQLPWSSVWAQPSSFISQLHPQTNKGLPCFHAHFPMQHIGTVAITLVQRSRTAVAGALRSQPATTSGSCWAQTCLAATVRRRTLQLALDVAGCLWSAPEVSVPVLYTSMLPRRLYIEKQAIVGCFEA